MSPLVTSLKNPYLLPNKLRKNWFFEVPLKKPYKSSTKTLTIDNNIISYAHVCIEERIMIEKYIERKYLGIYIIILNCFIFFGLSGILTGAAMPEIIRNFSWNYKETSTVLIATPLSFFFFSLLTGSFLSKVPLKNMILAALIFLFAGLFGFGIFSSVIYNFFMKFLIGAGCGILEVISNYTVGRIEKRGSSHLMGVLHSFFSIGSILGPFLLSIFIKFELGWIMVFKISAFAIIPLFIAVIFTNFMIIQESHKLEESTQSETFKVLFHIFPILSFLIIFFYVAFEMGLTDWSAEYLVKTKSISTAAAASFVSTFWIGLFIGRLGNPFFLKKLNFRNQLLFLIIIASTSILGIINSQSIILTRVLFVTAGYGCSSIYPLVMTIISNTVEKGSHSVVGLTSAGGGLGAFLFPIITGTVSDEFGIATGFSLYLWISFIAMFIIILYNIYLSK